MADNPLQTRRENQLEAATKSAETVLRSLLILNGGASVALLSLLAAISTNREADRLQAIIASLIPALQGFAVGAGLAVLAAGFGYIANYSYAESVGYRHGGWHWSAVTAHVFGVVAAIGSLAAFAYGAMAIGQL